MVYVTGDTHANQFKWNEQIDMYMSLHPGDTIIVLGDFGVGFWDGRFWSEETPVPVRKTRGWPEDMRRGNKKGRFRLVFGDLLLRFSANIAKIKKIKARGGCASCGKRGKSSL